MIASGVLVLCLSFMICGACGFGAQKAYADEQALAHLYTQVYDASNYEDMTLDELKKEVELREAIRANISGQLDNLDSQIIKAHTRLVALDKRLPVQEGFTNRAVAERYKVQRHNGTWLDALTQAQDFQTFLDGIKYVEAASKVSLTELTALRAKRVEFEASMVALDGMRGDIDAQLDQADANLKLATEARDEAQRRADRIAAAQLVSDGADWSAGEERFVEVWAPRINAYFAGTPMANLGEAFAKAAWANQIDPRFSPAISCIESSKGRYCIRPHNAWGWGAADSDPYGLAHQWATWEDAINTHVRGLARGYGYTVSVEGAQKYCPFSWEDWYVNVVNEMNRI